MKAFIICISVFMVLGCSTNQKHSSKSVSSADKYSQKRCEQRKKPCKLNCLNVSVEPSGYGVIDTAQSMNARALCSTQCDQSC